MAMCGDLGGQCVTDTDGFYIVSAFCMVFGIVFLMTFIIPTVRKLQGMFLSSLQGLELLTSICTPQHCRHPLGG